MEQAAVVVLVVVIVGGGLSLRLVGWHRRARPESGGPDPVERWFRHVIRGDRED